VPGLNLLTFWSRKSAGQIVASQNGCLAAISELALAARAPDKKYHHCVLLGHSFGGLVLGNTISHSILDAGSSGVRNSSPWDMAVAFNSADSSIGSRQLIAELNYLYKYDEKRHAYVARTALESGVMIEENRPFLVILQSENDQATGAYFPIGTGVYNTINLRFHWDKVSVPGTHGLKVSEEKFYTRTPGNRPSTGKEVWRRWQFVYSGNARVPCWIVRVPKDIIWGHGGLWSDNSVAMLGALFRMHFPLEGGRIVLPPQRPSVPTTPDLQQLNQE
jgi:hypothetical protein